MLTTISVPCTKQIVIPTYDGYEAVQVVEELKKGDVYVTYNEILGSWPTTPSVACFNTSAPRNCVTVLLRSTDVNLKLTKRQASVLMSVLYRIGGNPNGPRGEMDKIAQQLKGAGVKTRFRADNTKEFKNNIFFPDTFVIDDDR